MRDDRIPSHNRTRIAFLVLLPFAAILALHAHRYWPFISDDALISLRYAKRLLAGNGLTWTAGHPVEGYSNLLWILLIAALGMVGVDLVQATRALGLAGMTVIMFSVVYWRVGRNTLEEAWFPMAVALLFLSLGAPIAVWAIGGLEQPLFGALIAISIPLTCSILERAEPESRQVLNLSFVLGLLCITRPDGPLFAVVTTACLLAVHWRRGNAQRGRVLLVSIFPIVFFAGQLVFRVLYYGELVPNTALVKMTPSSIHWHGGWVYLAGGIHALAPLSFVSIACRIALVVWSSTRSKGVYLLAMAAGWSAYVVFIGGDIFPAYRHLIPLMVVFAFALSEGLQRAVQLSGRRWYAYYPMVAIGLLLAVPYAQRQLTDKQSQRAIRERWEWECRDLALMLKEAFFRQQPLIAVTAAGCLPYWSELPALDMMGLNDYYLPRHPPPDFGTGFIGHELGDGRYVLSRNPDIIIFNTGSGPFYRSGEELDRTPEFHARYVPVTLRAPAAEFPPVIYVNRDSATVGVGITKSQSSMAVPGFLFTGTDVAARLDRAKRLVAIIPQHGSAAVTFESASPIGDWTVNVRASPSQGIAAALRQSGRSVSVTVSSTNPEPVEIEQVELKRP
jgi:arabinofuranosyltransferase